MLMYFNHVVNFFFYFCFGPNFQKEIAKLVKNVKRVCSKRHDAGQTAVNTNANKISMFNTFAGTAGLSFYNEVDNDSRVNIHENIGLYSIIIFNPTKTLFLSFQV
jgi:hypothetical protein